MLRCMIVEIHAVTLFNSRNSNILHAAVASTFSLQANSSRVEEALRPTDSLRQHPLLLAQEKRMFSQATQQLACVAGGIVWVRD